jgi:hypothetical protein
VKMRAASQPAKTQIVILIEGTSQTITRSGYECLVLVPMLCCSEHSTSPLGRLSPQSLFSLAELSGSAHLAPVD